MLKYTYRQRLQPAYEVHNPRFTYLTLEQQIEFGVNDWRAKDEDGHPFVGETKAKAEANRARLSAHLQTA